MARWITHAARMNQRGGSDASLEALGSCDVMQREGYHRSRAYPGRGSGAQRLLEKIDGLRVALLGDEQIGPFAEDLGQSSSWT
jgi:hypothetical protein